MSRIQPFFAIPDPTFYFLIDPGPGSTVKVQELSVTLPVRHRCQWWRCIGVPYEVVFVVQGVNLIIHITGQIGSKYGSISTRYVVDPYLAK